MLPSIFKIKEKQYWNLFLLFFLFLVFILLIYYFFVAIDSNKSKAFYSSKVQLSPIVQMNTNSIWSEKIERELSDFIRKQIDINKNLELSLHNQQDTSLKFQEQFSEFSKRVEFLEQEINFLKKSALDSVPVTKTRPLMSSSMRMDFISQDTVISSNNSKKNINNYVPSGTFVTAILLGGADASAAATSQSNPRPLIFRITQNAEIDSYYEIPLKGCLVTAAVIGDISSERGEVRLETLSCVRQNGEILDTPVQGTVFGKDGKNGMRGIPVWKEGAIIQRAAAAGLFSGFSEAISQRYTTNSISPLGNTQTIDSNRIWQYGTAKGAGNAMSKLADYYIQRAEQYHPVIQLTAGNVVDIVFLKGFYLDSPSKEEKSEDVKGDASSLFLESKSENVPDLPLNAEQIKRLKQLDEQWNGKNPL